MIICIEINRGVSFFVWPTVHTYKHIYKISLGKLECEVSENYAHEFVGLRAEMYTIKSDKTDAQKAKRKSITIFRRHH